MKTELRCFTHEMFKLCKKQNGEYFTEVTERINCTFVKNSSFETSEDIA